MSSPPASPQPKRGVRSFIREQYDKLVKSQPRSPSHLSVGVSRTGAHSTSPSPRNISSWTTGNSLTPPSAGGGSTLQHARSVPQMSPGINPRNNERYPNTVWSGLRTALQVLQKTARLLPPLESAVGTLITCLDLLESTASNREEYNEIASELRTLSESLSRHINESSSGRMSDCIANVALSIEQQARMIKEKQNRDAGRRLMDAIGDQDEVIWHYRRIKSMFRQLQTDANLSTWGIANEHLANTRLEGLMPAKIATYDSTLSTEISRRACTEGTRTAILSGLDDWSHDTNTADLYWMDGMAGTGKTTVACSFSKRLEERKQLAASFFCTRTSPECRQVSRIVPTIAYQLARYSIPFQSALCEILGNDPDIGSKNIAKQFERLLKEPLLKVAEAMPDNLVVVIDALDECEDRYGVGLILDLLFKFAPGLPLKFFVTSRPEPEIYNKMISQTHGTRTVLHLHEIEKSMVQADIELYLQEELRFMSPTTDEIRQLVARSGNLFIYAATLVRYIRPVKRSIDPRRRLRSVLEMTSEYTSRHAEIDTLYAAVLTSALDEEDLDAIEAQDLRDVLHTVLCVQEPVGIETLAALTGISDVSRALSALQPLRSVLHISESSGLVSTLHASFPDFMFSRERSGSFFCDVAKRSQLLARRCFKVMQEQLRFNICSLGSSFVPDEKVPDLQSRIQDAISPALWYACRYWADHLPLAANSNELSDMLRKFLSLQLLFWMEVLNLRREIAVGTEVLVKAKLWLQSGAMSPDLVQFAEDAQNFVTSYAANPISQYTPHIYISSLPLCPRSSSVFRHYQQRTRGLIELKGSGMEWRETAALASWKIGSQVRSVAYSADGTRVAFGCDDGTVGIRNAYDGTLLVGPLKSHTDKVMSVAFSPDGTRVVSGSNDCTIHVWDTRDGTLVLDTFRGHTAAINSVQFSPDGKHIVSGSADHTVRIWNAVNGTPTASSITGHTDWVRSVAFSPDGTRIASGSDDCTIRIWSIHDKTLVAGPFKGHEGWIFSVAFSPDSTRIVSGSADCTVRVWNAQDGTLIAGSSGGHTDKVYSVAFSPDGTHIVSSSRDNTIGLWSLRNETLVADLYEGHADAVFSVAFSPDGMRAVSGSYDRTVRIWGTRVGSPVARRFHGHVDGIWAVAFSPDGTRVASGCYDSTICVWSAHDGTPVAEPFKGHAQRIWSLAFSPDGALIVSGSADYTIRVWNTHDGTLAAGPLKGHDAAVNAIAFSPDGTLIASGSADRTIRVWSLHNGTLVADPFRGHADVVHSVGFSPDSTHVVSGSYDHTIQVWNSRDGTLIAGPFKGHTDWVLSVAFSPDGARIVSGSKDHTIRVWDIDGTPFAGPFQGHTDTVNSVAFSPDGGRIASGSFDRTVRIWSIPDSAQIVDSFYGHTQPITSVAFSPDGTRVISGSIDQVLRMWNTTDSRVTGHTQDFQLWAVRDDGWIINESGCLLFWVPPEVLRSLLTPHCAFIINRSGLVEIDFSHALLGDRWHGCYISE